MLHEYFIRQFKSCQGQNLKRAKLSLSPFYHIISIPAPGLGIAVFFSGTSTTTASVVSIIEAIDAAFCKAVLVTFVGSTIPALNMSVNSSL